MPKSTKPAKPGTLVKDLDYYIEKGYWVFTALFLSKRGYCCDSGCRHCPYKKEPESPASEAHA